MSTKSKITMCKHCSTPSCVTYSTHGKDDALKAIITSEEEAAKQYPAVQAVIREAMTGVLLRMHEYQQTEERALQRDPLSVLTLHAPRSNAAAMDISAPTNVQQQQQKRTVPAATDVSQKSKKLKKDDLWHQSNSRSGRESAHTKEDDWHTSQKLELIRQVSGDNQDEDENEYLYAAGPPCSHCSSAQTLVKYDSSMSSMSGTRSEIWGNKDREEGGHSKSTIVCKACGFEKTECSR